MGNGGLPGPDHDMINARVAAAARKIPPPSVGLLLAQLRVDCPGHTSLSRRRWLSSSLLSKPCEAQAVLRPSVHHYVLSPPHYESLNQRETPVSKIYIDEWNGLEFLNL